MNDVAYGLPKERWFRSMLFSVYTSRNWLSNIDRNLTGTRLRLRKNRNKINPARVRIPSQLYCCRLSLKQQKVLLSQSDAPTFNLTKASCWRFTKRTLAQARIHTGFHPFTEIGRFCIINIFLVIKMLSKLKSGKCWTRLASHPLQYGN